MARALLSQLRNIVDTEPIRFRESNENHSITPVAKLLLDLAYHKNKHASAENSAYFSVKITKDANLKTTNG